VVVQAEPFGLRVQLFVAPLPWQVKGARQSLSAVHVVLQAVPPHMYGEQLFVAGVEQVPDPLLRDMGVYVDPLQLAAPHDTVVAACWQAPSPLHAPVLPQGAVVEVGHLLWGSAAPVGTLVQVPALPWTLQARQVPQDADAQQTPSTQLSPVRQSVVALQVWPWRFLVPHRLVFGSQMSGVRQSVSALHAVLQLVVPLQR
jgi:hypothetical protein